MLRENRIDELFKYLEAVANSLENEKSEEKVRHLLIYLKGNRDGISAVPKKRLETSEIA